MLLLNVTISCQLVRKLLQKPERWIWHHNLIFQVMIANRKHSSCLGILPINIKIETFQSPYWPSSAIYVTYCLCVNAKEITKGSAIRRTSRQALYFAGNKWCTTFPYLQQGDPSQHIQLIPLPSFSRKLQCYGKRWCRGYRKLKREESLYKRPIHTHLPF